jgi:hypothetical protein
MPKTKIFSVQRRIFTLFDVLYFKYKNTVKTHSLIKLPVEIFKVCACCKRHLTFIENVAENC